MKTRLSQIALWLAGASLLAIACYNPNIAQGGFRCGDGGACPQNFHCASDSKCYRGDAGPDTGATCESPPPAPLCSTDPTASQACNPGCQRGCSCGWCEIAGNMASCSTAKQGTKTLGQVCDPTATSSECMPGYLCQAECGKVGRCYRLCNAEGDCNPKDAGTSTCSLNSSTFRLCTLPSCDPFQGTGCPSGSACYALFPSQTFCGCAGTNGAGATCVNTDDCQPGNVCIGGSGKSHCTQLCDPTSPVCDVDGGGSTCANPTNGSFGFCM